MTKTLEGSDKTFPQKVTTLIIAACDSYRFGEYRSALNEAETSVLEAYADLLAERDELKAACEGVRNVFIGFEGDIGTTSLAADVAFGGAVEAIKSALRETP